MNTVFVRCCAMPTLAVSLNFTKHTRVLTLADGSLQCMKESRFRVQSLHGILECPRGGALAHPVGLTCGAFEQRFGTGGWEFDCQKSKSSNARGEGEGERGREGGDVEGTN